jgi:lipoprotein NlpD
MPSVVDSSMPARFGSVVTRLRVPLRCIAAAALVALLASCASRTRAPVEDRTSGPSALGPPAAAVPGSPAATPGSPTAAPVTASETPPTYIVKRGDTLYQIALDTGLDYRELAAWNNIENVNLIRIGQALRLTAPGDTAASASGVTTTPLKSAAAVVETRPGTPSAGVVSAAAGARNTDIYKSSPKALKEPYSEQAVRDVVRAAAAPADTIAMAAPAATMPGKIETKPEAPQIGTGDGGGDDRLEWVWPAKGKVIGTFSETANLKGIDIAGAAGQPVFASAAGSVVYAGTGLRGYGKLIIIKHNKTYLSAYAHNRDILVKEGQSVTKGQKIAEMGNTDTTDVKLHFEIRRLGKPMDPARYLPPA